MQSLDIRGLVAASFTPMTEEGDLALERIPAIVEHLLESGISGIYLNGSTGEGMLLTDAERRAVAEAYIETVAGRMKTFVQVGHTSWRAAAELAEHAAAIGADAISATSPGYFKPSGEESLVDGLGIVCAAAPNTPFYYYHIPALSGIEIDPVRFARLAEERLPSFVGIKYSDGGTFHNLPALRAISPRLDFLSGSDEAYLSSVALGYRAAVGSTYNFAAPLYQRVERALLAGDLDEARLWQGRAVAMIDALLATCGRAGLKVMMELIGLDCGPPRTPIDPASREQVAALKVRLEEMGFFQWIKETPSPVLA